MKRVRSQTTQSPQPQRWFWPVLGGLAIGMGLWGIPGIAAESIVLKYGPIRRSLPVADLRLLADTGEVTPQLNTYLKLARQDPEKVRAGLNNSTDISAVELDRMLNSVAGTLLLNEVGEIVHPPAGQASRQALRSALILDASDDQRITLIDTLEYYPTAEVEVEGRKLVKVMKQVQRYRGYAKRAQPALQILGNEGGPLLDRFMGGNGDLPLVDRVTGILKNFLK